MYAVHLSTFPSEAGFINYVSIYQDFFFIDNTDMQIHVSLCIVAILFYKCLHTFGIFSLGILPKWLQLSQNLPAVQNFQSRNYYEKPNLLWGKPSVLV